MHFAHICDVQRYHVKDIAHKIFMKSKIVVVVINDVLKKLISKVSNMNYATILSVFHELFRIRLNT